MNYNSSFETMVQNQMNETNLESIGIYGLFGRYNIEIPFENQVNIFIGENGLGKTTILNCIYFLLEKKFYELANIKFSLIKIKFKNDSKTYSFSRADIIYYDRRELYENNIIEDMLIRFNKDLTRKDLNYIAFELARKMDIPMSIAKNKIVRYINTRDIIDKNKFKENNKNIIDLEDAIDKNVTHRIIYLPTYRRIEDDFSFLNLRNDELNKEELLIRFGMSDVQSSIIRILEKIRSLAMKGFTEMTGVLLKQYSDGKNPLEYTNKKEQSRDIDSDIVKIVLDRVGNEIEESYKNKILSLVRDKKILKPDYLYLLDLINKLIDNYELQKAYDDRIKKFSDTCNKYLNDKYFVYNQSTLNLDIFLEKEVDSDKNVIQLTELSSGEKQIVSLFSKLYLESEDKSIVIIDEPELSLSIQWQKMLLPDIMRTSNCDLLLTVTHSPFIFENEFDYDAKEIRRYMKLSK